MRKKNLSLTLCLVGGLLCVLFAVLGLTTMRNIGSYQSLSTHNALGQLCDALQRQCLAGVLRHHAGAGAPRDAV